ncbi:MAG: dTMP kinase [Candidatus Limnocylindria bacterium]
MALNALTHADAAHSRGRFITLEGPEGSGKTTAARHLADWLQQRREPVLLTGEPGGTPLGQELRRLLLHLRDLSLDLDPRADALLFAAGRAQHVARRITPSLESGSWVVCARYLDSSIAYQGYGYGLDVDALRQIQRFATHDLTPDLTILLDVPVEIGLTRKQREAWNRFENEAGASFLDRVREGYRQLASAEPDRFVVIDGSRTVAAVDADIQRLLLERYPALTRPMEPETSRTPH